MVVSQVCIHKEHCSCITACTSITSSHASHGLTNAITFPSLLLCLFDAGNLATLFSGSVDSWKVVSGVVDMQLANYTAKTDADICGTLGTGAACAANLSIPLIPNGFDSAQVGTSG